MTELYKLNELVLVHVSGTDTDKFLQGQLTHDMSALPNAKQTLSAHCDAKGKVWAVLRLWRNKDDIYYLVPKSVAQIHLKELKKYAVFSKITINPVDSATFMFIQTSEISSLLNAVIPAQSTKEEVTFSGENQNCLIMQNGKEANQQTILKLNDNRYLIVHLSVESQQTFIQAINQHLGIQTSDLNTNNAENIWLRWQIQQGIPVISERTSNQFIPQAINLQALDAISFTKGCYTGQEMVARAKYRGANKRALYCLSGSENALNGSVNKDSLNNQTVKLPEIGSALLMQLGENWRETGTILAITQIEDRIYLQAVLNNDLNKNTLFRLPEQPNSQFNIDELPYSILES